MRALIPTFPSRVAFLALLSVTVAAPSTPAQNDNPSTGARASIYGRVYTIDPNDTTLRMVAGAQIELNQGDKVFQATTDARGFYQIDGLSAGAPYFYKVTAAGYRDEASGRGFNLRLTEGDAVRDFTLQKGTTDPNAKPPELPKVTTGQLCGQVYEKTPSGELFGVNGAEVYLRKIGTTKLETVIVSPPTEGKNSSGYFANLEAGQWQIIVQAVGFNPPAPAVVEVLADQMADPKDLILTRPASDSASSGTLVRTQPASPGDGGINRFVPEPTGDGGMNRFVPEPSGDGGVTRFKPTFQGLRGTISVAGTPAAGTPAIRASLRRVGDRADASTVPVPIDAQGNFKVDRPPGRYVLVAEADGCVPEQSEVSEVLAGSYTFVSLKLERSPAELVVKVFNAETKQPLGEATVRMRRATDAPNAGVTRKSDAAGLSSFKGMEPAENYQLQATMTGYKAADGKVSLSAGASKAVELYLIPEIKPATLTVKVLDGEKREGLGDTTVVVTPVGEKASDKVTDAKGMTKVEMAKPNRVQIAVRKSGYVDQQRTLSLQPGENNATFLLQPVKALEPSLTLIVTDAKKGTPLAGVELSISPATATGTSHKTTPQGSFDGKLAAPGRHVIELKMPGYEPATETVVVAAGNNTRRVQLVPVVAKPPTRVIVAVVEAGDQTRVVPGARVQVQPTVRTESPTPFDGVTDAKGTVSSTPLAPQTYTIVVEKEGYNASRTTVTLSAGDSRKVVTLSQKPAPPPTTFRLTLQVSNGASPIPGATIKVERVAAPGASNDKGTYDCVLPAAGKYAVTVTKTGFEPNTSFANVASSDVTHKVVLRPVPTKPVEVAKRTMNVLVREGGRNGTVPIEGAKVKVLNAKQEVVSEGVTDGLGRFSARRLDVGVYTIQASKESYTQRAPAQSDIRLGDDQPEVPLFRDGGVAVAPPKRNPAPVVEPDVSVPNVDGKDLRTAQATIESAKLTFQPVYADPAALTGKATSQQPAAGTKVKAGTKVAVVFKLPAEAPKVADTYAAIVFSQKTRKWGAENRQATRESAERLALDECKEADAKVAVWVKNGYCALYFDENNAWAVGLSKDPGASAAAAKKMAMDELGKISKMPARGGISIGSKDTAPELFGSATANPVPQGPGNPKGPPNANPVPQGPGNPKGQPNPGPQGPGNPKGQPNPGPQGPGKPAEPPKEEYGAIAFSPKTGRSGYSNGNPTREAAEKNAVQECKADDARSVMWAQGRYCAIVFDENNSFGAHHGESAEVAKQKAIEQLKTFSKIPPRDGFAINSKASQPEKFSFGNPIGQPNPNPGPQGPVNPKGQPKANPVPQGPGPNPNAANSVEKYIVVEGAATGSFVKQMRNGRAEWLMTDAVGKKDTLLEDRRDNQYIYLSMADKRRIRLPLAGGTVGIINPGEELYTATPIKIKREREQ